MGSEMCIRDRSENGGVHTDELSCESFGQSGVRSKCDQTKISQTISVVNAILSAWELSAKAPCRVSAKPPLSVRICDVAVARSDA